MRWYAAETARPAASGNTSITGTPTGDTRPVTGTSGTKAPAIAPTPVRLANEEMRAASAPVAEAPARSPEPQTPHGASTSAERWRRADASQARGNAGQLRNAANDESLQRAGSPSRP